LITFLLLSCIIPPIAIHSNAYPLDNFTAGVSVNLPTSGDYNFIAVGDVDGDGNLDIASGGDDYGSADTRGLYVYRGNGAGTWTEYTITASNTFGGIAIADCDNDGVSELYATYESRWGSGASNGVGAWEWTGAGFGAGGISSPLGSGGTADVVVTNVTGNASLDMAVATQTAGIKYYEGDGSSPISWTERSTGLPGSGEYTNIDVADMNDDGRPDIVAGAYSNTGLVLYTQDAGGNSWTTRSGSFPPATGTSLLGAIAGDLNGDGNQDVIYGTRDGGMGILLGNGGGMDGATFVWTTPTSPNGGLPASARSGRFSQLCLADIDMDGDLDLLAPKAGSGLHLYLGNGSINPGAAFGFTEMVGKNLPTTGTYYGANFLDFDDDGDLDVAGATWGNGIGVYETNVILPPHPIAFAGNDQTVQLGETVYLNGTDSRDAQDCRNGDTLGDILTYDWNLTDQPNDSTVADGDLDPSDSSASPSFVPTHSGIYVLSLVVRDTDGHYSDVEDVINITAVGVNTPPVADAGEDQEVETGALVTLNGSLSHDAQDPLGLLEFDWNESGSNPASVSLSDESSVYPTFTAPMITGTYRFTLVVRDSLMAWSMEDVINISVVLPPNVLPVAHAGEDLSGYSNTTISLDGSASEDPDGDIVTWDWNSTSHPAVTLLNENSSSPSFTPNGTGTYLFTLTVRDDRGGWATEDEVRVTVIEVNRPPVVNAGEDFTAYFDEETQLNGSASHDPEGHIAIWNWTCLSHSNLTLDNENTSAPSFVPGDLDMHVFELRVKDDLGLWSTTDIVNVTVIERPVNLPPVANAGRDRTIHIGDRVTLNGSGSSDTDGSIVDWEWTHSSNASLVVARSETAAPYFYANETGNITFTLRVRDDGGKWSAPDTVRITVVPLDINITDPITNNPPTVKLTSPRGTSPLSGTVRISWVATDDDLDEMTYSVQLLDQDGNLLHTLASGLDASDMGWDWNTTGTADGTYLLRVTAFDGTDEGTVTSTMITLSNEAVVVVDDDEDDDDGGEGGTDDGGFFSSSTGIAVVLISIAMVLVALLVIFFILRGKRRREKGTDHRSEEEEDGEGSVSLDLSSSGSAVNRSGNGEGDRRRTDAGAGEWEEEPYGDDDWMDESSHGDGWDEQDHGGDYDYGLEFDDGDEWDGQDDVDYDSEWEDGYDDDDHYDDEYVDYEDDF